MKRVIAFGMAVTLTVCLAACGKRGKEREDVQASGTAVSVTEPEGADTEDNGTVKRTLSEPAERNPCKVFRQILLLF